MRAGKLTIAYKVWNTVGKMEPAFKKLGMMPLRVNHDLVSDVVEVVGLSDYFDEIADGEIPPEYIINMTASGEFSVDKL